MRTAEPGTETSDMPSSGEPAAEPNEPIDPTRSIDLASPKPSRARDAASDASEAIAAEEEAPHLWRGRGGGAGGGGRQRRAWGGSLSPGPSVCHLL